MTAPRSGVRCPCCAVPLVLVHVHGHGQCSRCGTNVEPCCTGADAASEVLTPCSVRLPEDPALFERLFERLGGRAATLTRECLLREIARALDVPLDEAGIVLDVGLELRKVVANGTTVTLPPAPGEPPVSA